jgi:hypothetical protein
MYTVLLVILILILLGTFPVYPYSQGWGYWPSGLSLLLILGVLVLLFGGR